MSRIARQYKYASFFHVIVQGINKEEIFKRERYINEYTNLIEKFTEEINIDVVAYCIMTNHAHFLVRTNNIINVSKLMQKVNSLYARYYNYMENGRVGYVFRDRFLSEPIDSKVYFINCIKYIHMNPVKAGMVKRCNQYKFSSFNLFVGDWRCGKTRWNLSKDEYQDICQNTAYNNECMDIDKCDVKEKFDTGLSRYLEKEQIKVWQIYSEKDRLKELVKYLKNIEGIKYVYIKECLDVSRGTMESMLRDIRKEI